MASRKEQEVTFVQSWTVMDAASMLIRIRTEKENEGKIDREPLKPDFIIS